MVATLQHDCNRSSGTDPSLFRNDYSNVAALQSERLQEKLMEETARLQWEQLEEVTQDLRTETVNKGKIQQERDELLREMETLRPKKGDELGIWENERQDLNGQLSSMSSNNGQQRAEIETLKQTVTGLEGKIPNSRQDNCLPFQYHNSTVMIVNLGSQMALDAGKDGDKAHAWQFSLELANQVFTLAKVGSDPSPDSYWTIARKDNGKNLYFPRGGQGFDVEVGSGRPGKQDYWLIGRGSSSRVGSWVIKNAEWGTCIELVNGTRADGTNARSYESSDRLDANWVIIPLTFTT